MCWCVANPVVVTNPVNGKERGARNGENVRQTGYSGNMSKTSASVSSGVPDTEKQMKARGRRPCAFIVSRCLEPLMKHEV